MSNTGNIATTTLNTTGQATLNSAAIANNATVGGTLFVTGVTTTNGISNTGSLTSTGNTTIGSGASSTVTIGNQNGSNVGTSTVSFNNNRLQNVANATATGDAVNLGQVNQLIASSGGSSPALQSQVNGIQTQVNNLQTQVNQNNLIAQRGIASTGAIAGIPAIEPGKNFSVGVGLGNYVSASAISVGAQVRLTGSTVVKIAAGTTTYGGVVTTAGLGISF
jgi:hypothetical protein